MRSEPREVLARDRERTLTRLAGLTDDFDGVVAASRDTNADDEHDPEGATIAFERAQAMALLEETRIQVEALDTALARVDHGSYGVCESCGQDIAPERLAARPSATLCITCASRRR